MPRYRSGRSAIDSIDGALGRVLRLERAEGAIGYAGAVVGDRADRHRARAAATAGDIGHRLASSARFVPAYCRRTEYGCGVRSRAARERLIARRPLAVVRRRTPYSASVSHQPVFRFTSTLLPITAAEDAARRRADETALHLVATRRRTEDRAGCGTDRGVTTRVLLDRRSAARAPDSSRRSRSSSKPPLETTSGRRPANRAPSTAGAPTSGACAARTAAARRSPLPSARRTAADCRPEPATRARGRSSARRRAPASPASSARDGERSPSGRHMRLFRLRIAISFLGWS